jgi:ligand-binding SRPBCC domain-containing protein
MTRQMIHAAIGEVFALFEELRNTGKLTPPVTTFEIPDVDHLPMRRGTTIDYRIKPVGVQERLGTESREKRLVDLQARGPYRYWRHQHSFTDDGSNTRCRSDTLRILDHRAAETTQVFGQHLDVET